MRLSYHHLNPHRGNESFLLRFEGPEYEGTPCVLVDAGDGCSLEGVLEDDDRLVGILLTHAHLDHYRRLPECHREGVPVYTSPATANLLPDVLDEAEDNLGVQSSDSLVRCLTPITDETSIDGGIDVRPLPAGHAPGAVGFLLRIEDDEADQTVRIVITGDFTARRSGGYPGLDAESLLNVDVLFLTAATNEEFPDTLTDALADALDGLAGGGPVLVTTSGLNGVQVAYLLGHLLDRLDCEGTVRVVGQVAKHYASLDYDVPNVEVVETFDDPATCIDSGVITVAGPEVPVDRSSGRLFDRLEQNSAATVVQVTGGGYDPVESAGCSLSDYRVVNHPSRTVLRELVETTEPKQTILTHHSGVDAGEFMGDWSSYVWATNDGDEHVLYADGEWQSPPWVEGGTELRVRSNGGSTVGSVGGLSGDLPAPDIDRETAPDPEAEGVLVERLEERLRPEEENGGADSTPDTATSTDRTNDPVTAQSDTPTETMAKSNDTTDSSERGPDAGGEIYDTVSIDVETPTDEQIEELVEDDGPDSLVSAHARQSLSEDDDRTGDPEDEEVDSRETDQTEETDDPSQADEEGDDAADLPTPEPERDARSEREQEGDTPGNERSATEETVDDRTSANEVAASGQTTEFVVDPTLVTLAKLVARTEDTAPLLPQMTREAIRSYLTALLGDDDSARNVSTDVDEGARIEGDPVVDTLVDRVISEREDIESVTDIVVSAAVDLLEDDAIEGTIPVSGFSGYESLVDAVVENDDLPGDSRDEVVQAAVAHWLGVDEFCGRGDGDE